MGRNSAAKNSTNRTSPSPDGGNGHMTQKEKESLARSKIAQEEKRFTTYLKRHYSPNMQTMATKAGSKTNRFDYLGQL